MMAKAVGVNWVRLHDAGTEYIGWSFLEPEKGKWQFRDADLRRYRDHNLKTWSTLYQSRLGEQLGQALAPATSTATLSL